MTKPVPDKVPNAPSHLPLQQPGPGVRSLLRGHKSDTGIPACVPSQDVRAGKPLLPRWYFFAADILLIAMALVFIFQCPPGTKWGLRLFSMIAVTLGCCLGLAGVWMGREK